MPDRGVLVLATLVLAAAAVAIWIAALMPQFFPVWAGDGDALDVIGRHPTLWRVNAILFGISAVASLIGCALAFPASAGPMVFPSLLTLTVATALWVANTALRATVVADVATNRDAASEAWLAQTQSWTAALWLAASPMVILAFAGLGATVLTAQLYDSWLGWVILASALFSLGLLVFLRDVPPVVAYLPVLPLAVATALAAAR